MKVALRNINHKSDNIIGDHEANETREAAVLLIIRVAYSMDKYVVCPQWAIEKTESTGTKRNNCRKQTKRLRDF